MNQSSVPRIGHVSSIDGLRAVAVVSVLIFHLDPVWLKGGFAGVDIFFVISGFVVAASVARFQSSVSLVEFFGWFYKRRILRILPALGAYLLVAVAVSLVIIPAVPHTRWIEATGIAALLGASNFILAYKSGDYFSSASSYNPFTHTWSLAIEEQYYLVFPFLAYGIFVLSKSRWSKFSISLLVVLVLASLWHASFMMQRDATLAFYMITSRFWELGIGFLAFLISSTETSKFWLIKFSSLVLPLFVSLVFCLFLSIESAFPFPGALSVCAVTACLLAFLSAGDERRSLVNRFLSSRLMISIGLISYSIYIWHWGVIVFLRWTIGMDLLWKKAIACSLTLILAAISYHFVEKPFRSGPWSRRLSGAGVVLVSSAFIVLFGAVGSWLVYKKYDLFRTGSYGEEVWSPYALSPSLVSVCQVSVVTGALLKGSRSEYIPSNCEVKGNQLFVLGDSHAGAYSRMLYAFASATGQKVTILTLGGCRVVSGFSDVLPAGCDEFMKAAISIVRGAAKAGDVLFVPALYMRRYRDAWDDFERKSSVVYSEARVESAVLDAVSLLSGVRAAGVSIVLELPKPVLKSAPFRCVGRFDSLLPHCQGEILRWDEFQRESALIESAIRKVADSVDGRVWGNARILCSDLICNGFVNDKPVYFDTDHLSGFGNDLLLPSFMKLLSSSDLATK